MLDVVVSGQQASGNKCLLVYMPTCVCALAGWSCMQRGSMHSRKRTHLWRRASIVVSIEGRESCERWALVLRLLLHTPERVGLKWSLPPQPAASSNMKLVRFDLSCKAFAVWNSASNGDLPCFTVNPIYCIWYSFTHYAILNCSHCKYGLHVVLTVYCTCKYNFNHNCISCTKVTL